MNNTPIINRIFAVIAIILLLSSCNDGSKSYNDVKLDNVLLEHAQHIVGEKVDFPFPITTQKLYVDNDSIVIVLNRKDKSSYFVELFNINDTNYYKGLIRPGNGPGEMLDITYSFYNDTLLVKDIHKNNIAIIPIHKAISDSSYTTTLHSSDIMSQFIWPYQDKLLAVNPNCFTSREYGINNDGPRFILSDTNYVYKEDKEYKYDTFNVTGSKFFISYPNNRIVLYMTNEPRIEIYDTDFNLIRTITGPELPEKIKYANYYNFVVYEGGAPFAYSSSCFDSEYFYITYYGRFSTREIKFEDFDTYILKFDWDGNFINSYFFDFCIKSISMSNDGRCIYAFGTDHDGESVFYKYLLK